jgi:hypothetical protein
MLPNPVIVPVAMTDFMPAVGVMLEPLEPLPPQATIAAATSAASSICLIATMLVLLYVDFLLQPHIFPEVSRKAICRDSASSLPF